MHHLRYLYKGRFPFSSHNQLAELIINNEAKNVLDIGCYMGFIGQALREKNWHNKIVGLDKDKNCQIVLKNNKYNKFFYLDIEKNFRKISGKYDAIVFADVLEHLNNPYIVLKKIQKFLNKNGKIYISVPNIANIFIRLNLLFGKFDYQDYGILDKDHRFFFTSKSIRNLINHSNLNIIYKGYTPIPTPLISDKKIFKKALNWLYYAAKLLLSLNKNLFSYQFIFVCIKK